MSMVPPKLKTVGHYFKIADEYANRDNAIHYWCLLYGVQKGMQVDRSSPDCKQFLTQNLSALEQIKKQYQDNEAITNDVVASAHVEECALKLFAYADREDRASNFNKNVVKAFYTAGYLLDVLSLFGELDGQILQQQKYAKWKAAYIHNCLRNGETPVPGPTGGEEGFGEEFGGESTAVSGFADGGINSISVPPPTARDLAPAPQPNPAAAAFPVIPPALATTPGSTGNGNSALRAVDCMKAQKFCKYAVSALEYEDVPTAVENLKKALEMLQASEK